MAKESAVSRGTMIFHRDVIWQFHCNLLLSSEIAKTEAIVAIVEPVKLNAKRASLFSSDLIDLCINLRIYYTDPQQHEIYLFYMI